MSKPRLFWLLARTFLLAGVSYAYAHTQVPIEGVCAKGCKAEYDDKGKLIGINCVAAEKGVRGTECSIVNSACVMTTPCS